MDAADPVMHRPEYPAPVIPDETWFQTRFIRTLECLLVIFAAGYVPGF